MQKLTTSSGKTIEIKWINGPLSNGQIVIALDGDHAISEISPAFENQDWLKVEDDYAKNGMYSMFEGYTALVSVSRMTNRGITRLTLERGE